MTLSSEKLSTWVNKVVPGGRALVVLHEQAMGGPGLTVATWMREDVDEARENGQSIGAEVLSSTQDHADSVGESCRFQIQWQNDKGQTLRSIVHRAVPTDRPTNEHALHAEFVSPNAMIGQLLSHISQQQRVINGSIGAVLAAYERALVMQQKTMETQASIIIATRQELATTAVLPAEAPELTALKTRAFEKLLELGPDVIRTVVASVVAHKFASNDNDDEDEDEDDLPVPNAPGAVS